MKYLSVCAGIEAASVAWHPLGWKAAGYSEIEPFPSAVLKHHYPEVTNFGDMTKFKEWNLDSIDLLVGGTPCQSFSVAGLRKGLADPRGNLALVYCGILDHFRPKWFVWENVPGVLSSNGGRDFGSFLGALAELGYGFAYRVLDAQYFGVAQRRRRVFVVGYLGDWRPAAEVLFERESVRGDTAPSREKRQEVAGTFTARAKSGGWGHDVNLAAGGYMQPVTRGICASDGGDLAPTVTSKWQKLSGGPAGSISELGNSVMIPSSEIQCFDRQSSGEYGTAPVASTISARDYKGATDLVSYGIPGCWIGRLPENGGNAVEPMHDISPCLTKMDRHGVAQPITFSGQMGLKPSKLVEPMAVAVDGYNQTLSSTSQTIRADKCDGDHIGMVMQPVAFTCSEQANSFAWERPFSPTITAQQPSDTSNIQTGVRIGMAVRRLTPVECERLQGFPDNYTNIPWRKAQESPDGPRYKVLGNSMAVPVMAWIGQRIANYEQQTNQG